MICAFVDCLLPAPRAGSLRIAGDWVWCASPTRGDDGRYHLFASRWSKGVSFFHWATNSEIIRASADRPEGPYRFEQVVIGHRDHDVWDGQAAHNPAICFHNGTYLLFYTGTTYRAPRPTRADEHGLFSDVWVEAWNNKRIGLATAASILGPWKRADRPILSPRPGKWDAAITSNVAPWVHDDGSVTLLYKSASALHPTGPYPGRFHLGAAHAPHWTQPFKRLSNDPISIVGHPDHHLEDPCLWWSGAAYRMIAKDMTGEICGEAQAGIHATSPDAITWTLAAFPKAYSRTVCWDDGTSTTQPKLERPQMLIEASQLSHLFCATLEQDDTGQITDSWNMVIPLGAGMSYAL
jgi:hypothetical protein